MPARSRKLLLGDALREARLATGISQEELAFEAKLDRTYISHLENGHKSPTVDTLFQICPVLGIAVSELISNVEHRMQSRRR